MKIGYISKVSTEKNIEIQTDALLKAGCEKIFEEKSSILEEQKELKLLIEYLRKGDTVIVWRLICLRIRLLGLIKVLSYFNDNNIHFKSLTEDHLNTSMSNGKIIFSVATVLAECQREYGRERSINGLASAKLKGKRNGRPKGLSEIAKVKAKEAAIRYKKGDRLEVIMEETGIGSKATLYRYLRYEGLEFYTDKTV